MYQRVIAQAKKAVKEVDCSEAVEENDFDLVYTAGKAQNSAQIEDKEFGIKVSDSYRLIRTVEMYQT